MNNLKHLVAAAGATSANRAGTALTTGLGSGEGNRASLEEAPLVNGGADQMPLGEGLNGEQDPGAGGLPGQGSGADDRPRDRALDIATVLAKITAGPGAVNPTQSVVKRLQVELDQELMGWLSDLVAVRVETNQSKANLTQVAAEGAAFPVAQVEHIQRLHAALAERIERCGGAPLINVPITRVLDEQLRMIRASLIRSRSDIKMGPIVAARVLAWAVSQGFVPEGDA